MQKQATYKIKGMNRDLAVSAFNPEFAFENHNVRMLSTDDNTLLSIVNERGNKDTKIELLGTLLGYAILNNKLILFTKGEAYDYIELIEKTGEVFEKKILYGGETYGTIIQKALGFDLNCPIETLPVYENEKIQKVYWTDGKNLPRVINIAADYNTRKAWNNLSFDFARTVNLDLQVEIKRNTVADGIYSSGVILYAFTYYTKYGLESNIIYTSPLYYISYSNRGASPEDSVSNSFSIKLSSLDKNFDYIRVYSIHRSSVNAVPEVKKVVDLSINKDNATAYYTDGGTEGYIINPTELFYLGCEDIVCSTLNQKDNTLFLGNIKLNKPTVDKAFKEKIKGLFLLPGLDKKFILFKSKELLLTNKETNYLSYNSQLGKNSSEITTFKYGEFYRFGLLFLDSKGKWSDPVFMTDAQNLITIKDYGITDGDKIELVQAEFVLPNTIVEEAIKYKFKRVRPVIVYPDINNRNIICLGILCPTVFNVADRDDNSPYSQSSWFTRVNSYEVITDKTSELYPNLGTNTEFRHFYPIPKNDKRNAEIQCIQDSPGIKVRKETDTNDYVSRHKENFFVDLSILTFHSPDIEFDSKVKSLDFSNLKLRLVGAIPIYTTASDIDILTSTTTEPYYSLDKKGEKFPPGFYKEKVGWSNETHGWEGLCSGLFWLDEITGRGGGEYDSGPTGFMVYPWHRNGSMNNDNNRVDEKGNSPFRASLLSKKKMSNIRYSKLTFYIDNKNLLSDIKEGKILHPNISGISVFDSNEVNMIKIHSLIEGLPDITYYGNIDKVITPTLDDTKKEGYPIIVGYQSKGTALSNHEIFKSSLAEIGKEDISNSVVKSATGITKGIEPVRMKYKSTPHVVISLKGDNNSNLVVLPRIGDNNSTSDTVASTDRYFFDKDGIIRGVTLYSVLLSTILNDFSSGYLWLGELYRDSVENRFGGTTEEAIENNQWVPCGDSVELKEGKSITLVWDEGDTYYLRYDCLKTYPFTLEDQNSIVDIVSFKCETRVNIDGRYDRNRGLTSNLVMTPTNFNKMNSVYSLPNNFFTYRGINSDKIQVNNFLNVVTWTQTKTLGELIDSWTNITLAGILDLDGDKGYVNSIKRFNNDLIVFLDKGISLILYNDSMQITTTEGVPIEIANSGKVSGKRYISDKIGCYNKWSICETPAGLYFVDDFNKDIYLFNGKINNLSDSKGFHSWVNKTINTPSIWNLTEFKGIVTHYDKSNGDVLFITKDLCLAYSEPLGQFSSFYSYENTPYIISFEDKVLDIKDKKVWELNEGEYNYFYGAFKPFSTTVVVNPDPTKDKIFNNVEFRADSYRLDSSGLWQLTTNTFDTIIAENEYLHGELNLNNIKNRPSSLKKKFRVWRANIPRDSNDNPYGKIHGDRIRNPWIYLTIKRLKDNKEKTLLHDLTISYFE